MTRVDFYSNAPDKLTLARQIVHKAYKQGLKTFIFSTDNSLLNSLDARLWSDVATSFMPHSLASAAHAQHTPVILGADLDKLPHRDLLINLDAQTPVFFTQFARLIEIVSTDEPDRLAARQRWSYYKQNDHPLTNHDMSK
ncbi:MAG: DNA polymerase III subunit chi [Sulfuriferula sp.]|nr:DNA polymerase III subunit chi [Sulfuriferula sp.]